VNPIGTRGQVAARAADTARVNDESTTAPGGEHLRLAALHDYRLVDEPADSALEAVVRVAALLAGVPTATANILDQHRQCQLTTTGFTGGDSPRAESMCAVRLLDGETVYVPDASRDPVYRHNPWVTGVRGDVRFYASAPLITADGHVLGTLCVFDEVPRELSGEQIAGLEDLAEVVIALFERRRQARLHAELAAAAEARQRFTDTVLDTIDVAVVAADGNGRLTLFNRAARDWHGLDPDPHLDPREHADRYDLFEADGFTALAADRIPLGRALRDGAVHGAEMVIKRPGETARHLVVSGRSLVGDDGGTLGAVVAMTDVTSDRAHRQELHQAHQRLARAAETDSLTGLVNRAGIRRWLADNTAAMHPADDRLVLAFIDLDHFKDINDARGHATGDAVLRGVAGSLSQVGRPGDLHGRLGGDEFTVAAILPATADIDAWRRRIEASATTTVGDVTVRGSVGTVVLSAANRCTVDELIDRADQAMYRSKARRRRRREPLAVVA
jgi:diguanylate cyclase (GGDEF)-like protein